MDHWCDPGKQLLNVINQHVSTFMDQKTHLEEQALQINQASDKSVFRFFYMIGTRLNTCYILHFTRCLIVHKLRWELARACTFTHTHMYTHMHYHAAKCSVQQLLIVFSLHTRGTAGSFWTGMTR